MPNQTRYGLTLLLLVLIALAVPAMAVASQANDPTPLVSPTVTLMPSGTPLPVEPTAMPATALPPTEAPVELTDEPDAEVTAEAGVQLPVSERVDPVDAGEISIGDTLEGTLSETEPAFVYTLTGTAGQSVRITLMSEDFDPYLVLEDADGNILDTDDDSAGSFDSRIGPFSLPADGEYRIVAQSFAYYNNSGAAVGDFTISVEEFETRRIEYTQEIAGTLTIEEPFQEYEFTGEAGDSIMIRLTAPSYDAYLTLLDDNGFDLISNDDSGGSLNSQIGPYELLYTGTYIISATSYSRSATGDYTLSLDRVELQPIAYGDTLQIEVEPNSNTFFFNFEANAGEVINVYAESDGSVNTDISLTDPYNSTLISDQDGGRRYDPEIVDFIVTSTGTHTLVLNVVDGEGTVSLTLERGVLPSLDEGTQQISFNTTQSNQTRALSFTGVAGQSVHLSFSVVEGATSGSPNITITQQGTSIAYASASYVSATSIDFTVPYDGEVFISVIEYSYTNISYEVALEQMS